MFRHFARSLFCLSMLSRCMSVYISFQGEGIRPLTQTSFDLSISDSNRGVLPIRVQSNSFYSLSGKVGVSLTSDPVAMMNNGRALNFTFTRTDAFNYFVIDLSQVGTHASIVALVTDMQTRAQTLHITRDLSNTVYALACVVGLDPPLSDGSGQAMLETEVDRILFNSSNATAGLENIPNNLENAIATLSYGSARWRADVVSLTLTPSMMAGKLADTEFNLSARFGYMEAYAIQNYCEHAYLESSNANVRDIAYVGHANIVFLPRSFDRFAWGLGAANPQSRYVWIFDLGRSTFGKANTLLHELGHTWGLGHASEVDIAGGDCNDPMGFCAFSLGSTLFNPVHAEYMKWASPVHAGVVVVASSPSTPALKTLFYLPAAKDSSANFVRIDSGSNNSEGTYYASFRTRNKNTYGADAGLTSVRRAVDRTSWSAPPFVLLHLKHESGGTDSVLLGSMLPGDIWSGPAGNFELKVLSVDDSRANIQLATF